MPLSLGRKQGAAVILRLGDTTIRVWWSKRKGAVRINIDAPAEVHVVREELESPEDEIERSRR